MKTNIGSWCGMMPKLENLTKKDSAQELELPRFTNAKLENHYKDAPFSMPQLEVSVTIPTKTFLEKILLLHEEFSKPRERIRSERMSRHLFDLHQLYHTKYGKVVLVDDSFFEKLLILEKE